MQEDFNREISLCQELSKKNRGKCNWGECAKCGVIPFMYKIFKEKVYEGKDEIKKLKEKHRIA